MEAMSSEGVVEERVQPPRSEELALGSADEAAGGSPGIPFVSTQVPPPVTEELAVGSGEAREEPLQRSEVLNRLQEPPVGSTETREQRRSRLLGLQAVNPPDIKRSKIPVDKHAIPPPAWQTRRWHYVKQDNLDLLNELVLPHSMLFSIETLQQSFINYKGNQCSWIEMMNDRNITAQHKNTGNILEFSGRWRLFDSCADYAEPWKPLSHQTIFREFKEHKAKGDPWSNYIKDLCRRYEGEVALAWSEWTWSPENLPRAVNRWQPQFATDEASMSKLLALGKASTQASSEFLFSDDVNLVAAANTTVLYVDPQSGGHWRRRGNAITLAELLYALGQKCTVSDIMFWYCHAPKVVKKRRHAWASADRRDAAYLRLKTYGHWGHKRGPAVGE